MLMGTFLLKATIRQLKTLRQNLGSRTSRLCSVTHGCSQASRKTATEPAPSCRSSGCSYPPASRSVARNTRRALAGRLSVLAAVALQWEIHSADKTGLGGGCHYPQRPSDHDL